MIITPKTWQVNGECFQLPLVPGPVDKLITTAFSTPAILCQHLPDFFLGHLSPAGEINHYGFNVMPVLADKGNSQSTQLNSLFI